MIKKGKIILVYLLSIFILMVGVSCCGLTHMVFAKNNDEYSIFSASLEKMRQSENDETKIASEDYYFKDNQLYLKNDLVDLYSIDRIEKDENDFSIVSANVDVAEDELILQELPSNNRLIVISENKVEDYGAVLKADYKKFHIYQYDNSIAMQNAFRNLKNSGITVSYDYKITAQAEDVNSSAVFNYHTWADKYVGYSKYTENLLKIYPQTELKEVVVAVFDSGIYSGHELFQGRIHKLGKNFTSEKSSTGYEYEDFYGHGTHVSGTIAELTLPNVKILPLKILNSNGDGEINYIIQAVAYLDFHKNELPNLKLANLSLGIERKKDAISNIDKSLMDAVQSLFDNNILPVVSAGNDHISTEDACPANVYDAITVSAVRKTLSIPYSQEIIEFASSYSNFGPHVDFAAPGSEILSAGISGKNAYVQMNGTSMAAPHVTAAAALLFSNPNYASFSPKEMTTFMTENACVDLGKEGRDNYYGYGLINIESIGISSDGYVYFENISNSDDILKIKMSYNSAADERVEIYYSLDEDAKMVDKFNHDGVYSAPIELDKTTKVTAVAYIYDSLDRLVKLSLISSKIFAIDNIDLVSNFQFENDDKSGKVVKYLGDFSELNMIEMTCTSIGANAFAGTNVEILHLPKTLNVIYSSAFSRNLKLQQIDCSANVSIQSRAFYECRNLSKFNMKNATNIGELAFAYATSLQELNLPNVYTFGKNAISGSAVKKLTLGENADIQEHKIGENSLTDIYGYEATNVDEFAIKHGVEFHDLTLKIESDFAKRVVIKPEDVQGGKFEIKTICSLLGSDFKIMLDGKEYAGEFTSKIIDGYKTEVVVKLELNSLDRQSEHSLYIIFKDDFGNEVQTRTINIVLLSASATPLQNVTLKGSNFQLFVDGAEFTNQKLYKGVSYEFEIVANEGYVFKSVSVNNQLQSSNKFTYINNSDELVISASVEPQIKLLVDIEGFDTCDFLILKDGNFVPIEQRSFYVSRGESISLKLTPRNGYDFYNLVLDDEILQPENEVYTIADISKNINLIVQFAPKVFNVNIIIGRGGNVSANGINEIVYGEKVVYKISTNKGYKIDYVTVNNEKIKVVNNSFEISNVTQDTEIIIAFKKDSSIISHTGVIYLIIFFVVLVVFAVASLVLYEVRKKTKISKNEK